MLRKTGEKTQRTSGKNDERTERTGNKDLRGRRDADDLDREERPSQRSKVGATGDKKVRGTTSSLIVDGSCSNLDHVMSEFDVELRRIEEMKRGIKGLQQRIEEKQNEMNDVKGIDLNRVEDIKRLRDAAVSRLEDCNRNLQRISSEIRSRKAKIKDASRKMRTKMNEEVRVSRDL